MSFSKNVKEEILKHISNPRHCRIAEMAAMMNICGNVGDDGTLIFKTEYEGVAEKFQQLLKKVFQNDEFCDIKSIVGEKKPVYFICINNPSVAATVKKTLKLNENLTVDYAVVQSACCKRAFIRGSYIVTGSMSNPEKTYHLEFVMPDEDRAQQLVTIINSFSIDAKIVLRKKNYVVYIKEGSQISDLLNIMEAHVAMMEFENVRILKEMRNSINRQVNCEAANISKTVAAAAKQIDDIMLIRDTVGLSSLSEGLAEIAELRISYPEASLKELGNMLSVPLGRSGVNHRLKKLCSIAEGLGHKEG